MTYIHPLNKMPVVTEGFQISFKSFVFVQFLNVIWHLVIQSNSSIYDTFPEKIGIAEMNM
jgi:hypothetical protein